MIATTDLIESLAADATPVRRLRPPFVRAGLWLLLAFSILLLFGAVHGVRANLMERLQEPIFATGVTASLMTGVLAAVATFMSGIPGRSRHWVLLPAPSLGLWLSTIGYGGLTNWVRLGPGGIPAGPTLECFATLVAISVPLSLVMLAMLRYVAAMTPMAAAMVGSLAVSAVAATGLMLFHELDATVMVLIWNLGTTILIAALAGLFGRMAFSWMLSHSTALRP